ncbi:MAG TPA: MFS transporter, partial [Cyclobacteriaceae bacterium]|nr:MFS transporter [Cyclobacteriaceae bacterium]
MTENSESPEYRKNTLLLVIILTSVIHPFLGAAVNIALPDISSEFSMNAVTLSWVPMSFLLSSAVFLVPLGKLSDIAGRKKIFLIGNTVVLLTSLLCALSVSGVMLITIRVIQGVGSAMIFGTGTAIITSAFPPSERGKAIGYNVSAVYFGLSVAPLIGGLLTQAFGWRSLFLVTIPFMLFTILVTVYSIRTEWAEAKGDKFDYMGTLVYLVSFSVFMFGFSKLPEKSAAMMVLFGLAGLVFFVRYELNTRYPVFNIRLFIGNPAFTYSNLAALINYAATFAITFLLSLYLQYIKGFPPREAGLLLALQPVVMTVFASFSGRLSDKFDSRILSSLGMSILVIGLIMLTFLGQDTGSVFIAAILVILGMGFGLFSSPNTNAVMGSVDKKYLGIASATVGTMRVTGQMISMG